MPLQRRLPKRGFRPPFRKAYTILHVRDLNVFPKDSIVEPEHLVQQGFLNKSTEAVKLLADGELNHALVVRVHKVSQAALKKVEAAAGRVEVIGS